MIKIVLRVLTLILICSSVSQSQRYDLSWKKDAATVSLGLGLAVANRVAKNKADVATLSEINSLRIEDINFFDRGAVDNNSVTADKISDVVLFSSFAFPVASLLSSPCRENTGAILLMATEVALINTSLTGIVKGTANRYRPFNYNPEIEESIKLGESSRRSFISGHTSSVASFSFFTAKVITDLNPDIEHKKLIWATASVLPAVVGFLRVQAGKHFPTDVIGGYLVGASIGYLLPCLHLNKNENLNVSTYGGSGLSVVLTF